MKTCGADAEHQEVSDEVGAALSSEVSEAVSGVDGGGEDVVWMRLLPQDPRDMVSSAVRMARAVLADVAQVPRAVMLRPARESMTAVVWVLAAAADFENRISPDHRAALLAREAGVGTGCAEAHRVAAYPRLAHPRTRWAGRRLAAEHAMTQPQPQTQPQPVELDHRPHRSQALRHAHTAATATRRTAPWTMLEDEELAACVSADDLETFALRWSRTFRAVEQRRRCPRRTSTPIGTGWI